MKKLFSGIFIVMMALCSVVVHAEPERLSIKTAATVTKERAAKTQMKAISLGDIEDPAARAAIQQILNYLGLEARK